MKGRKVLYVRYNRNRARMFQTVTMIVADNGSKYVVKKSLTEEGMEHIKSYEKKYASAASLYKAIVPLKGEYKDNEVVFPFIEGRSMRDFLDKCKGDSKRLYGEINRYLEVLLSFKDERIISYKPSEECVQVFGSPFKDGMALEYSDIDIIFDNIIKQGDTWISYDYEWMFDFPIPIDYIRWRILYRYYCAEYEYFKSNTDLYAFMEAFGYGQAIVDDYEQKEIHFLSYVYDNQYNYMERYKKPVVELEHLDKLYDNLDIYINKLNSENSLLKYEYELTKNAYELTKNAYDATLSSLSWRITKPLRRLASVLRHEEG